VENNKKRNSLKDIFPLVKELGFGGVDTDTDPNAEVGNPYLCLENGQCLIALTGGFLGLVNTDMHFADKKLFETTWKSNNRNTSHATMTTTRYPKGQERYTESYYRVAFRDVLDMLAEKFKRPRNTFFLDHINHMRGDCTRENLQVASAMQNQRNRSKTKIEHAFYTIEDYIAKRDAGEWTPLANQSINYIRNLYNIVVE
jgi:hypothetical protein